VLGSPPGTGRVEEALSKAKNVETPPCGGVLISARAVTPTPLLKRERGFQSHFNLILIIQFFLIRNYYSHIRIAGRKSNFQFFHTGHSC
jgi:hypothetical protein